MRSINILKKPLITEKTSTMNENGQYAFIVDAKANKVEIKKAVEKMYGVVVESVNTMNYLGKPKTRYTKSQIVTGRSGSYKKAVVTVAKGEDGERDIIDFYSNI